MQRGSGTGSIGTVRVTGTFRSGAARLTWRVGGQVLAVWTCNIELDQARRAAGRYSTAVSAAGSAPSPSALR